MIIVNTHEAKTRLSQLLVLIENNHEIVRVCRNGKPIADIVPIQNKISNPLKQHGQLSKIKINYDPTAPLTDDEWPMEG
jgi:antitoxin (DNA-binding transcriptional repressor) of toxin-antitoxin stability system